MSCYANINQDKIFVNHITINKKFKSKTVYEEFLQANNKKAN